VCLPTPSVSSSSLYDWGDATVCRVKKRAESLQYQDAGVDDEMYGDEIPLEEEAEEEI
jgi:hypothetical protein